MSQSSFKQQKAELFGYLNNDKTKLSGFVNVESKGNENLKKLVQSFSSKEVEVFSGLIHQSVVGIVKTLQAKSSEKENRNIPLEKSVLSHIKSICVLIKLFLDQEDVVASKPIYDSVYLLHSMFSQFIKQTNILTLLAIIFILGDVFPEGTVIAAQSLIVEICELWFYQERDKRESVVLHSILFLMIKANQVNAQLSDLKRLFEFRDAFTLIDLDENNETIIDLIQRSAINSLFLAHDVGKKFLIFLLTTHPNIIDQIHVAIKSVLVQAQPWKVAVYAHIYFQAWKSSSGHIKISLEDNCFQNFIQDSIHVKNSNLLKATQSILSHFSIKRIKYKHIDSVLVRLYEPILWRALRNANPYVRRNALVQFTSAFPLVSDEWNSIQVEESLQKQFNIISELLLDGIPFVRVEAINLTGHILTLFIDFVPPRASQVFLSVLIQSLASDKNSSDVRVAVLKALIKILSAPLTHGLMKELLPELSNLIYDHSEKVRTEMVQLLETIKKIKGIKFYDIVKVEVLLSRLADDGNAKIKKSISKLLLETYFPFSGKKSTDLITRCIEAIKSNAEGAKVFYESLSHQVPPGPITKFIIQIWSSCISKWIIHRKAAEELGNEFNEEAENNYLQVDDVETVAMLFSIMSSMWKSILPQLKLKENESLSEHLNSNFDDSTFVTMHEEFANNENIPAELSKSIESSILELSSYLPAQSLPSFARVAILSLKPDSPLEILESLLKALFGWNYADAVKMIVGLLESPIAQIKNKKAKETEIADSLDEAKFGLRLLDMTLRSNQLCQAVLGNIESVNSVLKALNQYMEQGKQRLERDEPTKIPDLLLISAIELKYRLLLHTNSVVKEENNKFKRLLEWNKDNVFPRLDTFGDEKESKKLGKRPIHDDDWFPSTYAFAERVSQITLTLCSDFSIYGFLPDLTCDLFNHLLELLTSEEYHMSNTLFETITTIAFRTLYHAYHSRRDDEDVHTVCEKAVTTLIDKVPLDILKKCFPVCELFQLAPKRVNLKPIMEFFCKLIANAVPKIEDDEENIYTYIEQVDEIPTWLITSVKTNKVSMNILISYLNNKILGPNPSLTDKWRVLQIISVFFNVELKRNDLSPFQNLLLTFISSSNKEEMEVESHPALTSAMVKESAEALLNRWHNKK